MHYFPMTFFGIFESAYIFKFYMLIITCHVFPGIESLGQYDLPHNFGVFFIAVVFKLHSLESCGVACRALGGKNKVSKWSSRFSIFYFNQSSAVFICVTF